VKNFFKVSVVVVGCLSLPVLSASQSLAPNSVVSVRELSIPARALGQFQKGAELLAKKDAQGSLPHFQRAIKDFAAYYEAYYKMGIADLQLSRADDAEQAFRKSIELSGNRYAQSMLALGALLATEQKYTDAEGTLRMALAIDEDSWTGHYLLAYSLFGLNRLDEAVHDALEASRAQPDEPKIYLLLADIHGREKDYSAILTDLDTYLKLVPEGDTAKAARALQETARRLLDETRNTAALAQPQQ